jgi:hypothetical protein
MLALLSFVYLLSSSSLLATAAPTNFKTGACDLTSVHMQVPSNQTALLVPSGQTLKFIALGQGVQNYTCSAAGTFT